MERERSPSIFKVKGQISKSLGLYKIFWHLDPCGQDIARTMQSKLLKPSIYTLFIFKVKDQISRSLDLYKKLPTLGSLWAGMQSPYSSLVCTLHKWKRSIEFQGQGHWVLVCLTSEIN